MLWSVAGDHYMRNWGAIYGLLHQAVEQQTTSFRFATIKPKGELIKIIRKMRSANCALMNPKPPSVQQGGNKVNSWHHNMGRVSTCRYVGSNVFISQPVKAIVAGPSISIDLRSWCHVSRNKRMKAGGGYIRNNRHAYSAGATAADFCGYRYNRFSFSATTPSFLANTSNVGFVDFNTSSELLSAWAHHCSAQLMEPIPCRMVAAQPKHPLQAQSASAILLARDKPYCKKPRTKWLVRSVKQCSGSDGSLPLTLSTKIKAPPHQPRLIGTVPAFGATKTIWPSKSRNVVKTGLFTAKPLVEFFECSRIINANNWEPRFFHVHILYLVVG